jgi:Lantibiotic biosynthesis dehydratase C-term
MDVPSAALSSEWLSFHLAYSGDRDRLVTELVRPTVRSLWQEGKLASFFFLRHVQGGPHVRLRIRPLPASREEVGEVVRRRAASYLSSFPSPARGENGGVSLLERSMQSQEVGNGEPAALTDNSFYEVAFEPEIERYGGNGAIGASLDFFALSSARVLGLLEHRRNVSAGEWLTIALRLEARHVLGFAEDRESLEELLAELQAGERPGTEFIRERADRTFGESGERLVQLLRGEVEKVGVAALSPIEDGEVARALSREIAGLPRAIRARIFASQLHMTANRLGLANVEEAYVARILWRTFRRLAETDPATWNDLADLLGCRAALDPGSPSRLADLLAPAFATL